MSKRSLFFYLLLIYSLVSCDSSHNTTNSSGGKIVYKVNYPTLSSDNILFEMMPKSMNYSFSEKGSKSEISAGMGLFRSAYIHNTDANTFTQTVKVLNKKYQSSYTKDTFLAMNPKFQNIVFIESEKDTVILGYNCNITNFSFNNDTTQHTVYYTSEIGGKNPNITTPFEQIPGIMLKYTVENFGVMMDFTAEKIVISDIEESIFEISNEYALVTPEELKVQIESIFMMTK